MIELEFPTTPPGAITDAFFRNGCVLLRNFADTDRLRQLTMVVDQLYAEKDEIHFYPRDMTSRGLPPFHEYIFDDGHHQLLSNVFAPSAYQVNDNTASRKVDGTGASAHWSGPLGPHLDAFFHGMYFTINFWVPFRDCGSDAPSLGVVPASFRELVEFSGYDGDLTGSGVAGVWNFPRFNPLMFEMASNHARGMEILARNFAGRLWTPTYRFGDAMMLSNFTLHFTHATAEMTHRRGNIELRFSSESDMQTVIAAH